MPPSWQDSRRTPDGQGHDEGTDLPFPRQGWYASGRNRPYREAAGADARKSDVGKLLQYGVAPVVNNEGVPMCGALSTASKRAQFTVLVSQK